jgi:hypothetical protein
MKKLIVFLGILALVLGTGGVAKVCAGTYGTDITIYDNAVDPSQTNTWWNRGTANNYTSEDQETEYNKATGQGTLTGQGWDLEAYQQNGNILSIIGGFDFATGVVHEPGQSQYIEPLGALFLKTVSPPPYGDANIPGGTGTGTIVNSFWGYDYAITFDFTTNKYLIWTPTGSATLDQCHNASGGTVGDVSNPWKLASGWQTDGVLHSFTYTTGLADFDGLQGGSHNVISGIDLSFLVTDPDLGNPATWLHLTYGCGNDNLMGEIPEGSVPLPPAALLLGSGLVGLVGLGWGRKARAS